VFPALRVAALTGLSSEDWKELRAAFPGLPAGAGTRNAARRLLLARLAARRLSTGRWSCRLVGAPPEESPTVYVSAHLGSLQALRYTLRARGVAAANVVDPHNLDRAEPKRQDGIFDSRHPLDFPHVLPAARPHALRSALRRGSLIVTADQPGERGVEIDFLGGRLWIDSRPFRLARGARVPCRPAFLTLPRGRWTLTLGSPLPADEDRALASFGELLGRVAGQAPSDLDGVVYRALARERR
jgi:hypothetical protein